MNRPGDFIMTKRTADVLVPLMALARERGDTIALQYAADDIQKLRAALALMHAGLEAQQELTRQYREAWRAMGDRALLAEGRIVS